MCSVCGGRRAAEASPVRCVGERITATGVPEFREVAWRACSRSFFQNHFRPRTSLSVCLHDPVAENQGNVA
ncbi:hypothetical protein [Bathymodiolus japonicus methanotrophic gill symbiont]|uniref:hypothetical protein n=1 Tax=Bathymodiolus japonicus methanotrophic gill symbiont TaxID=113269 RepID=UPI001C8DC765|nr:hypothetical protein [Bathymodiolus japonicus methanotrophic gill symbiont]